MEKDNAKNSPQNLGGVLNFLPKNWGAVLVALVLATLLNDYLLYGRFVESIPYSQFLVYVTEGRVKEVLVGDTKITGDYLEPSTGATATSNKKHFVTVPIKDDQLLERLTKAGVTFRGESKNPIFWTIMSWVLPFVLFFFIWNALSKRFSGMAQGGIMGMTKSKAKVLMERDIQTRFDDVAGVDEAKAELQEVVSFLKDPKRFTRLGGRAPKGILLVGPPGTGKTLLARSLAGETQVPFFSINGSEFVEMFVGLGAARVRDLFEQARKSAPCILFIDEIDALGKSRALAVISSGGNDEKEQTLNQLLAEMDGFDSSAGVMIVAATNRPEILDPALLRAGRFDRQILVNFPDQAGRIQILKVHCKKIQHDPGLNLESVASLTSGFSGADLANLVNEAALVAVRREGEFVTEQDFHVAIERIVAGLEQKKKVINPSEKRRIAYHEMGHATLGLALEIPEKIHKVSIIPRGMGALGYTMQRPTEDRYLMTQAELKNKIAVLLGGRASEKLFLGDVSTGAQDDLARASDIARAMVTQFAMGKNVGLASLERPKSQFLRGEEYGGSSRSYSDAMAHTVDLEISQILEDGFQTALQALQKHQNFVEAGTQKLLAKETLTETEISGLWQDHAAKG